MSSFPLQWHKDCFANAEANLRNQEAEMSRMQARIEKQRMRLEFYRKQIEEAERRGKASFDSDKFMVKRNA